MFSEKLLKKKEMPILRKIKSGRITEKTSQVLAFLLLLIHKPEEQIKTDLPFQIAKALKITKTTY